MAPGRTFSLTVNMEGSTMAFRMKVFLPDIPHPPFAENLTLAELIARRDFCIREELSALAASYTAIIIQKENE